mgnify:CR=1 FL=1
MRTLVSALSIVAGALMIVGWLIATPVVSIIEDGSLATSVTERFFDDDALLGQASDAVAERAVEALAERGLSGGAVESGVGLAVDALAQSDAFAAVVIAAVDSQREEIAAQLTDPDREPAALTVAVDLSGAVNDTIDDVPVVGSAAPDVALAPIEIQLADADRTEQLRTGYRVASWLQQWGLWAGLALLVLGLLVSKRKKWLIPKFAGALAVACLAVAAIYYLDLAVPLAEAMPGPVQSLVAGAIADETADQVQWNALMLGAGAAVVAVVSTLIVRALHRR